MVHNHKNGFGLLEVLLAGLIIIMMLSALVIVARAAIQNSIYLQQRSQATFLAQEGMEIVRQIRDTNYIDGDNASSWDKYVYVSSWSIPALDTSYQTAFGVINSMSRYDLITGSSQSSTVGGTNYTRTIKLSNTGRNTVGTGNLLATPGIGLPTSYKQAYLCTVTVTWGDSKSVIIKELIANSRQGF